MGLKVEFKFEPKEKVQTELGAEGIVMVAGVEAGCSEPKYYVNCLNENSWWMESQLRLRDEKK